MNLLYYVGLFSLGALDTLEPGHGKALISSFLVGSNAKLRDVLTLGATVTLVHGVMNGLLAYGLSAFALTFFRDSFLRYIELLAGIIIFILALFLIYQRFYATRGKPAPCGCQGHVHDHPVSPTKAEKLRLKQILMLSLASGMTPCPVVLTALISAIALGRGMDALQAVFVFSAGMGAVLTGVGLLTIYGTRWLNTRWFQQPETLLRISRYSAVAVLFLGVFLIGKSLFFHSHDVEPPVNLLLVKDKGL